MFNFRCCDGTGCKRSYHLSCLDPPLEDVPLGAWHCVVCVKKKIESGVHSLSEGVESIWDVREVEISNDDGMDGILYYIEWIVNSVVLWIKIVELGMNCAFSIVPFFLVTNMGYFYRVL